MTPPSCRIASLLGGSWHADGRRRDALHLRRHEWVVASEFALLMRRAQLRRNHEGDSYEVRFDERDWQPGEPC